MPEYEKINNNKNQNLTYEQFKNKVKNNKKYFNKLFIEYKNKCEI